MILRDITHGAVTGSLFILGMAIVLTVGPAVERTILPVLDTFEFVPQGVGEDGALYGRFKFIRNRGSCRPAENNFALLYVYDEDGNQKRVNYERVGVPLNTLAESMPEGPNLGPLVRADFFVYPRATEWFAVLTYDCHPLWHTRMRFDNIAIPKYP